jgi:hypothetical protein
MDGNESGQHVSRDDMQVFMATRSGLVGCSELLEAERCGHRELAGIFLSRHFADAIIAGTARRNATCHSIGDRDTFGETPLST